MVRNESAKTARQDLADSAPVQYVIRLCGISRAELEAVWAYENDRLLGSGSELSMADILRSIIERAAIERGLAAERSSKSGRGLRVELQRGRAARARSKKLR